MDKFKELTFEETQEVEGGMDSAGMQPIKDASQTWWWKGLAAMNDAADFLSGLGDGFIKGFKDTNKHW
jgi:bacteriocin-like protein